MYTTQKDFELFKKEANKWIDRLSLRDWEYSFEHKDLSKNDATCKSYFEGKIIVLSLGKAINKENRTKREHIKYLAMHEVLHVLLENLYHQAIDRGFCHGDYLAEEHAVLHRLQNVFKELK